MEASLSWKAQPDGRCVSFGRLPGVGQRKTTEGAASGALSGTHLLAYPTMPILSRVLPAAHYQPLAICRLLLLLPAASCSPPASITRCKQWARVAAVGAQQKPNVDYHRRSALGYGDPTDRVDPMGCGDLVDYGDAAVTR